MTTSTKKTARTVCAVLVAGAAVAVGGLWAMPHGRKAPPLTAPGVRAALIASSPPVGSLRDSDPDPSFPTAEQTARYYGALVDGDRRALGLVESALNRSRAEGGNSQQDARLEELRSEYRRRMERHEGKLRI